MTGTEMNRREEAAGNGAQNRCSRNHSIDSLKFVCAILVVFIHCHYPYKEHILPITDVAVPLFFCISGYFVFGAKRKWSRIGRIACIFLWSAALYLAKTELFRLLSGEELYIPTWKNVADFVLFNDVAFSIHLWYLSAYIYVLVAAYFMDKYGVWKHAVCLIVPLLLAGVCIKYHIKDICPEDIQLYRNAYFNGLPFFLLGAVVKNPPPHACFNCLNISCVRLCLGLAVAALFILRYQFVADSFMMMALREMNLLLLTYFLAFLVVQSKQGNDNVFSKLGRDYSLYIYIFHVLVMQVLDFSAVCLPGSIRAAYMFLNPFLVLLCSIALTFILGKFKIINV